MISALYIWLLHSIWWFPLTWEAKQCTCCVSICTSWTEIKADLQQLCHRWCPANPAEVPTLQLGCFRCFPCSALCSSSYLDTISGNLSLIYPNFLSHATAQNEFWTSNPAWKHDRQEAGPVQADGRGGPACLGRCAARLWPQEERGRQTWVRGLGGFRARCR